jgi:hypothetical protein
MTSVGQAFDFVNTEGSGFSNISESDNHQFQLFGKRRTRILKTTSSNYFRNP